MQKHNYRNEHWHVVEGVASVATFTWDDRPINKPLIVNNTIEIPIGHWHQLSNQTTKPLKIIEIQYGSKCVEEDIERKES
jgi:mannose-6-phosphate isomerase-like protein (cupin superfamily)